VPSDHRAANDIVHLCDCLWFAFESQAAGAPAYFFDRRPDPPIGQALASMMEIR